MVDMYKLGNPWSVVLLRSFNQIWAHESGLIEADPNWIPNNLDIFRNDENTRDGTGLRDHIHVVDAAKGHRRAVDFYQNSTGVDVVSLGMGNGCSALDVVKEFEKASGRRIKIQIVGRR
jgi:UDP-glucose 4-epimerase